MQKKSSRKLVLSKETLRAMTPVQMSQVAGGATNRCESIVSNTGWTETCFHCASDVATCG